MLKTIMAKFLSKTHASDLERILAALSPEGEQECAKRVMTRIGKVEYELGNPMGRATRDIYVEHFSAAGQERRIALMTGARDFSDPQWAAAAMTESWCAARLGALGDGGRLVEGKIISWVRATLRDKEFKEALAHGKKLGQAAQMVRGLPRRG